MSFRPLPRVRRRWVSTRKNLYSGLRLNSVFRNPMTLRSWLTEHPRLGTTTTAGATREHEYLHGVRSFTSQDTRSRLLCLAQNAPNRVTYRGVSHLGCAPFRHGPQRSRAKNTEPRCVPSRPRGVRSGPAPSLAARREPRRRARSARKCTRPVTSESHGAYACVMPPGVVSVLGATPLMQPLSADLDALMTRLADGERAAFDGVFEAVWDPILRLCRTLLRNEADAADAAQEALQKILLRASDYDRHRPALPWALALAGWECRTILRKRTRRAEVSDQPLLQLGGEHPESELEKRDLVAAALIAVGELSELDQEVLMATFGEESSSASGATLRKRRERAIDRLRTTFRRLYDLD